MNNQENSLENLQGSFTPEDLGIAKLNTGRLALLDADRVKYIVPDRIYKIKAENEAKGIHDIYMKEELVVTETRKWVEEWLMKIDDPILFCFSDSTDNVFRSHLVSEKKYKGNRKRDSNYRYYEGKEDDMYNSAKFIMNNYPSLIVDGLEADDIVSALQDKDWTYIVSNDKDLKQIPGYHFNESTNNIEVVSEIDAMKHLVRQMIKGDTTDNIGGIPKRGDKYADSFIEKVDPKFYLPYLLREYQIAFNSLTRGAEAFAENLMLIKMKTDRGDYFKEKYAHMFDVKEMLVNKIKQSQE